jgi:sugar phosphate isomerase/epimerase
MMLEMERFGATTFLGFGGSLEEFIELVSRLRLGYLEVKCEPGLLYPREVSSAERARLKKAFQDRGITPTVHASLYDINLGSLNPLIREASVRQLLECLKLAHDLGAEIVVVHPGDLPGDYPEDLLPLSRANLIEGLREALELAERLGVTLALENKARGRNRGLIQFPGEHLSLIEGLGSANCRVAFDVGHAYTLGLDIIRYLEKVFPYLVEVHLHDNDGLEDQHLPLGKGTVKLEPLLLALGRWGYCGPLILEMDSVEDLRWSKEYLNRIRAHHSRGSCSNPGRDSMI